MSKRVSMRFKSGSDEQEILRALEANGKAFMGLFDMPMLNGKHEPISGCQTKTKLTGNGERMFFDPYTLCVLTENDDK